MNALSIPASLLLVLLLAPCGKPGPVKVRAERSKASAVSRELWKGLVAFNREQAEPLRYARAAPRQRADPPEHFFIPGAGLL